MHTRHGMRSTLLALAAVLLLGQALGRAAEAGQFGFSADVDVSRIELRLELFMVCLRVQAGANSGFSASAHLFSCNSGVCGQSRGRWS